MKKLKTKLLLWAAEYLGSWVIALYSATLRLRLRGEENVEPLFKQGRNVVYAFWHGRMFPLIYKHRHYNIQVLVSRHRDGEIISRIVERLGYTTARGSSSVGGSQALLALRESLSARRNYAFTPDGPRGPRENLKPGLVFFAQASGLPIIPVAAAARKKYELKTWDHFAVPGPFTKVVIAYGAPVYVPPETTETERERYRQRIEETLNRMGRETDQAVLSL